MKKILTFLFCLVLIPSLCLGATTRTVGPGKDHPTITEALNACVDGAGDTVEIYDGTYREQYDIMSTAKDWDGLTIKAATGETAVYWQYDNATYAQTGQGKWTQHDGNVYVSDADFDGAIFSIWYESNGSVIRCKPEGVLGNVDAENDFFHDLVADVVYLYIAGGADPDTVPVHLEQFGYYTGILSINNEGTRNVEDITIDGINFRYGSRLAGIYFYDSNATYEIIRPIVQNCTFEHLLCGVDLHGTEGSPEDTTIQDSTFDDCGGIDVDGPTGYSSLSLQTIGGTGKFTTVQDCTFTNAFRHHVNIPNYDLGTVTIQRNVIEDDDDINIPNWYAMDESHGIRIAGSVARVIYIKNNIITGMWHAGIDDLDSDAITYIYNNTIAYNGQSGDSNHAQVDMPGGSNEFKGNIIWGYDDSGATKVARRELRFNSALTAGNQCDYNLIDSDFTNDDPGDWPINYNGTGYKVGGGVNDWLDVSVGGSSPDGNSLYEKFTTDNNYPDFLDNQTDGTGNYHIASISPAIGQGLAELTTYDIDGDTRDVSTPDIGADEYKGPGKPPLRQHYYYYR